VSNGLLHQLCAYKRRTCSPFALGFASIGWRRYVPNVCVYLCIGRVLASFFFAESFFNSFLWLSSGFGSLCSECDVTDLLSQRWMEEEIGSFRKFVSLFPRFFLWLGFGEAFWFERRERVCTWHRDDEESLCSEVLVRPRGCPLSWKLQAGLKDLGFRVGICAHRETKFQEKSGCHVWQEDCVDFVNVLRSEGKSCLVLFAIE